MGLALGLGMCRGLERPVLPGYGPGVLTLLLLAWCLAAASHLAFAVVLRVLLPHVLWDGVRGFATDIVGVGVVVDGGSGESSSSLLLSKTLSLAVSHVGMGGILRDQVEVFKLSSLSIATRVSTF